MIDESQENDEKLSYGPPPARGGILFLGVLLTPIAAIICGFCCCNMVVGGGRHNINRLEEGLFIYFPIGAIGGGAAVFYLFRRWWKLADPKKRSDS